MPDDPIPSDLVEEGLEVQGDDSLVVEELSRSLAERTADLQRLAAEYANFRRRAERDRELVASSAREGLLLSLVPVLDDLARARAHGDLVGPLEHVASSLESVLLGAGLVRFGAPGDLFDPLVHEALVHLVSTELLEPTCVEVYVPGYRVGGRVLRPAQVVVSGPPPS